MRSPRALPLSLGEQPTEADLFNTLRGARVDGTGSLELHPAPSISDNSKPVPEHRLLTVIADTGATRKTQRTATQADLSTRLATLPINATLCPDPGPRSQAPIFAMILALCLRFFRLSSRSDLRLYLHPIG